MMKKLLALFLALLMSFSLTSVFAEEEVAPEIEVIEEAIDSDEVYTLDVNKINNVCIDVTGNRLEYILIDVDSVSPAAGTLLYNYDGSKPVEVDSSTKYYREKSTSSTKLISTVTFVPKMTFSGEVEINYTAYDKRSSTKDAYQTFTGKIVITISESVNGGDVDLIKIDARKGGKYKFNIGDFEKAFKNAGVDMLYMKFTLPDAENGKLYYNYSASSSSSSYNKSVNSSTAYYLDPKSSSQLSFEKVTLVIESDAASKFDLTYTVVDKDDYDYSGIITFILDSGDSYDTTYESNGESVFLRASDFNAECIDNTGSRLRSIKFSKPSSGTLWYDYDNEEDSRAQVSTSKSYYYDSEPYLYLIAYVPKNDYRGTVHIDYEGTSISNETYDGTITIKVDTDNLDEADDITYSVKNTSYKTFSASTFGSECKELTGETLDYIKFNSPSKGKLYYKYNKTEEYTISSSDKIYYKSADGDYLNYVSYVPQKNHTGTVTITYTGMTTEETLFKGEVKISVTGTTSSSSSSGSSSSSSSYDVSDIKYSGTVGKEIKFSRTDFSEVCDDYTGDDLDYVVFTAVSSSVGSMYYDYDGDDEEKIGSSDRCYYSGSYPLLSEISFIPKTSGTIKIKYRAYPEDEDDYTGYVCLTVKGSSYDEDDYDESNNNMGNFKKSKTYVSGLFKDVDENEWYGANSSGVIKSAYAYGLIQGRTDGTFDPNGNMTVAEAITIAARISDVYYEDNAEFGIGNENWYDDYIDYAVEYNIIENDQFVDYNINITREEIAMVFANILPRSAMEEINDVDSILDVNEDNIYFGEIIHLYRVGILGGDATGKFNPKNCITRAEVSAIISRIVDLGERLRK